MEEKEKCAYCNGNITGEFIMFGNNFKAHKICIENAPQQLQAYKDKEDKVREIAKDMVMPDGDYGEIVTVGIKILQILNKEER